MPREFQPRRLVRRAVPVLAALTVLGLVVVLAPGLGEVRERLGDADPGWLALAVLFEALSGVSYVLMFRPIFCRQMPWRTSWEISWSSLAVGSIVPASGAGGLALGAWILHEGGMPADRIARRSVAFFLIKSSVNFVAVAVLGTLLAVGLVGPELSLWLTAAPAAAAVVLIAAVVTVPRLGPGPPP
ncbi:MAG: lysylphosphatidylglycerol synthase domain-containing protein, partial [Pseudonocardiaceae bacterium]